MVRIVLKLHNSLNRVTNVVFSQDGLGLGSKKKDDEMKGKAIKVIDLLQHSAELGNTDALFTLGLISFVSERFETASEQCSDEMTVVPSHAPFPFGTFSGVPVVF